MNPSTERHPAVALIYFLLMAVVALVLVTLMLRFSIITRTDRLLREAADQFALEQANADPANTAVLAQAELTLIRAQDSVESVNLILSFLEGASVLTGLLIAGLGYFGLSRFNELDKEKAELIREKNDLKRDLEAYRPLLEQLQNNTNKIDNFEGRLETSKKETLNNFNLLIRSMQDLSLKNYEQAHESAITLLESSPDNTEALYIAGWLELQFVKGPNNEELLDSGIDRLKQACDLMPKSAAFMAALAVGYRRKARKFSKETNLAAFKDYMREAKKLLEKALEGNQVDNFSGNSTLIDLNGESFYGPLAACYRDLGDSEADFDKAIHYYTEATKLTPLSSYPSGNLAALYLETKQYKEALERFFKTIASARLEISSNARDYYAMMDAAMSFTMLGDFRALRQHLKKDAERIIKTLEGDSSVQDAAQILLDRDEWFNLALNAVKTKETLDVSLGGWERLLKATPDDWTVRQAIEDCMAKIKAKKETL